MNSALVLKEARKLVENGRSLVNSALVLKEARKLIENGRSLVNSALVLKEARKLIENGWCRDNLATVIDDKLHYCSIGAIEMAAIKLRTSCLNQKPHFYLKKAIVTENIHIWNDKVGKEEVLKAFDKAIELAEEIVC